MNIIEDFYKIQKKFHVLRYFELSRDIEFNTVHRYDLKIGLCDFENTPEQLIIECDGVSGLCVGDLNGAGGMFINIYDVSSNQLEGIKFHFVEEENHTFSFYCKSFSFSIKDE